MATGQKLEKAKLVEMSGQTEKKVVPVQFNPATLKLNFSNQNQGGNQPQGSSPQFVGLGVTKLTMELWFDVTLPRPEGMTDPRGDVRNMTKEVAYFMTPQAPPGGDKNAKPAPPVLKFHWGAFLFTNGTMDSMDETIDLFSTDGVPQRANVNISLSKHDLNFEFGAGAGSGTKNGLGTSPLSLAKVGDSLQQMAAKAGISDWQGVAQANGIENPRRLAAGSLVDLSLSIS